MRPGAKWAIALLFLALVVAWVGPILYGLILGGGFDP